MKGLLPSLPFLAFFLASLSGRRRRPSSSFVVVVVVEPWRVLCVPGRLITFRGCEKKTQCFASTRSRTTDLGMTNFRWKKLQVPRSTN